MPIHPLRATLGIVAGATLGVGVIGGWYAVTPVMTMDAMAAAAEARDAHALASYMDMDALRLDMRRQASRAIANAYPPGDVVLEPDMVVEALAGRIIDQAFSEEGARRALNQRDTRIRSQDDVEYDIIHNGPNSFIARLQRPRRVDLKFSRHLVGWRLTAITPRVPEKPRNIV